MHETAHFIAMALCGVNADSLTLDGAGMRLSSAELEHAKPFRKIMILIAGVISNFTAAVLFWHFGNLGAAAVNLFTGLFNILPIGELDGARLLKIALIRHCRAERVDRYMKLAAALSGILCATAVVIVAHGVPLMLIVTALYIIIMSVLK